MADETEYRIPIIADISDLLSRFVEAGEAATAMGEKMASAGDKGKEGLEKLKEGSDEAGDKIKELKEKLDEHTESVGKAFSGWEGLMGVLGLGGAAEVLNGLSERLIDASTEIQTFAARSQVSLSEASEMISTFEALGIETSALSTAYRALSHEVASGGANLHKLGIEITDEHGKAKSLSELYEETAAKLATFGNNSKEAADAQKLLGRQGQLLVQTFGSQKAIMEELGILTRGLGSDTDNLAAQGNVLRLNEVVLNEVWTSFANSISPEVVAAMKAIGSAVLVLDEMLQTLAMQAAIVGATLLWAAQAAATAFGSIAKGALAAGSAVADFQSGQLWKLPLDIESINKAAQETGNTIKTMVDPKGLSDTIQNIVTEWANRMGALNTVIGDMWKGKWEALGRQAAADFGKGVSGVGAPDLSKDKKGKSPATLDAEEMSTALQKADQEMQKLTGEEARLGNEADAASKVSQSSYAELAAKATADFEMVKQKYLEMVAAIATGSKKAAADATAAWDAWKQKFQADFDAARTKAEADMKAITAKADQLAGEVSSILDNAITGKLNWAQEMEKVLQKMLNSVVKYLFEMVAKWEASEAAKNAAVATGEAEGQAIQKAGNASTIQSDAGTAAANAYKAVVGIPYIGPFLAPAAAAVAYAGVMAFSAEAGFDVPPGLKPLTQLHPREMVLPESLATNVRNMSTAGAGGGPGSVVNQSINLHAWDGQSVVDTLLGNGGAIAGAMAGALRSGMVLNTGG